MDTSLPALVPPVRRVAAAGGAAQVCTVTRDHLDTVIAAVEAARAKADDDVALNGPGGASGSSLGAAVLAQEAATAAVDTMHSVRAFLQSNDLFEAPDGRVTNVSASFNIFGYAREAIVQLHYARHWAAVSASQNQSQANAASAVDCTERISEALPLLEALSADATRCYLQDVQP